MQEFLGSRETELKTFEGTSGFINGKQGMKIKNIKGSLEHVPPPPPPPLVGLHNRETEKRAKIKHASFNEPFYNNHIIL